MANVDIGDWNKYRELLRKDVRARKGREELEWAKARIRKLLRADYSPIMKGELQSEPESEVSKITSKALGQKSLGGEYEKELEEAKKRRKERIERIGAFGAVDLARRFMRGRDPVNEYQSRWLLDQAILEHARKRGKDG